VQKGQQIGTLDQNNHLHFEIRTQAPNPGAGYAGYLWVVGKSPDWVKARFTDPIAFLNAHTNCQPQPQVGRCVLTRSSLYVNSARDLTLDFWGKSDGDDRCKQEVEVHAWRPSRDFGTRKVTVEFGRSEQRVTVSDLDGSGPVNPRTCYSTGVSTVSGQAGKICHSANGLCDTVCTK
jgi:murein DD-endopeptidase MepM/ murein hydrolase activator NlpD